MTTVLADVGVPIKLLYEAAGHTVTIELKSGEVYRGLLVETEETMNCTLKEATMTARNGRVSRLENIFIRGGNIKLVVLPDTLKSTPLFNKVNSMAAKRAASISTSTAGRGGAGRGGAGRGGAGRGGAGRGGDRSQGQPGSKRQKTA